MHTQENLAVLQSQKICVTNDESETSLYTALRKRAAQKGWQVAAILGVTLVFSLVFRKHLLGFFWGSDHLSSLVKCY